MRFLCARRTAIVALSRRMGKGGEGVHSVAVIERHVSCKRRRWGDFGVSGGRTAFIFGHISRRKTPPRQDNVMNEWTDWTSEPEQS